MKVLTENPSPTVVSPIDFPLDLPHGLVGFPEHTRGEVLHIEEQLPFQWLRLHGPTPLSFVVIDPIGLLPDYTPELFDEDAASLGIETADDALVLNIVTVGRTQPATATANLVGPIIINRHTGQARQVVISNHGRYSARHPLVTAEAHP
jgi:flagellar assembly factor FliW